ncbi:MAG: hypothetical protein KKB31_01020 [Nanoarchaeota archaeon]|nr:hypothetical protein [Nanoarchaeota archaeon]
MNIAFDIHGTLDKYKILRDFLWLLSRFQHITSNVRVYIISGAPEEQLIKECEELGLPKKIKIISVVDYLKKKDVEMWQDKNGNWWTFAGEWWPSKGDICREYEIDILFDNDKRYKENIPDSTVFVHVG